MHEHIELYERSDGHFDWRVRATNGQIVATSGGQGFNERNDAGESAGRLFPDLPVVVIVGKEQVDTAPDTGVDSEP